MSNQTYTLWLVDGTVHRESPDDMRRTVCGLWITRYYPHLNPPQQASCKPCLEGRDGLAAQLKEKQAELAVAYGGGNTSEEFEWFSALDKAKKEIERLREVLETIAAGDNDPDRYPYEIARAALEAKP